MFRHALLKLMIPAAVLLGTQSASAESRLALVIGQSAYRSVPALPNPANDAKAVTQLLTDSGFEVSTAADLSQGQMREAVSDFAGKVAAKGADTVALVFYAGHGLQIDGENFLVPIDIDPKREADIPIQAVRLNDILNTLTSVPSKMRILMLDACRNNPFPDLKTAGGGLAIVDAKVGAPGTFLSFSTSPGAVAEDGSGSNSPYTNALLAPDWLVRHRRMVAWNDAVLINTASGYRSFLAKFPDSDLSATARKLEQRLRNRPEFTPAVAAANAAVPQNVALAGPTCPCNVQPPQQQPLKVNVPVRRVEPDPPKKRVDRKPPRWREPDDDVEVVRRPPPRVVYDPPPREVYEPSRPPVSIGIGIGLGGFGGGRGSYYGDGGRGRY